MMGHFLYSARRQTELKQAGLLLYMAFEKTKAAVESRDADETTEEQELKDVEETTDEQAHSSDETQDTDGEEVAEEAAETVVDWKARAEQEEEARKKAEEERDNYKRGLINEKAGKRQLDPAKEKPVEKPVEEEEEEVQEVDLSESKIRSVIYKDNEKKALRSVVDSKSDLYIPELVDDTNYNDVISFLPHTIDKSSVESIHRALKLAVYTWKHARGIKDEPKDAGASAKASIAAVKSTNSGQAPAPKSTGRKILKKNTGMQGWY